MPYASAFLHRLMLSISGWVAALRLWARGDSDSLKGIAMDKWVSIFIGNTRGLSSFVLYSWNAFSLVHIWQPLHCSSCCNGESMLGIHFADRERCCRKQMCIPFHTAFSVSASHSSGALHCIGHARVQAPHSFSNPRSQGCKAIGQESLRNWDLHPAMCVPQRKWVSGAHSVPSKSPPLTSDVHPDEGSSESEEEEAATVNSDNPKNEGIQPNEQFEAVDYIEVDRVKNVVEELFASDGNMEAALHQCGVKLSHSLVLHVLSRFCNSRKPAFWFFVWAGQQVGFWHNSQTYNMMMSILGRTKQFVTMCELMEEMGKKGSVLTVETFEIAIKAFAAAREMKKAVSMFDLMKRYHFEANTDTFNLLLDALGRAKLAKEAQMLFERMRERFPPDAKTYGVLLSGWCNAKNLTQAGKLWNRMVDEGFKPDFSAYNTMLEGLLKRRRTEEALKLFDLMKTNGPCPNMRSYTIVIHALSKAQKMAEALKFFAAMQEHGWSPDAGVYTCLIKGHGMANKLDQAFALLQEMKDKGCQPDGRTYSALIKVMANLKRPDEATQQYNKMIQNGFEPTVHTYNTLMKLYFCEGKSEMGFALWNEMAVRGCSPDINSYTVFIGGLIKAGRSQEACTYIEDMIDKGMEAPRFDYNKFLSDFSKAGRPDIFEELATKMKYTGKLHISNVFLRYSQKMKKRVKRRPIRCK